LKPSAMDPYASALTAYLEGDSSATLIIRRDDGFAAQIPVAHFFRDAREFSSIERAAIAACYGHVLDVGAGSGIHSLEIQSLGLEVTAIDISFDAVDVMVRRGVRDARCADIFTFEGGPFDTLLLLGNTIAMVETYEGLRRFLGRTARLTLRDGQVLIESLDVSKTDDPAHLAYHEMNRRTGRPIGMTRIQVEFAGAAGPYFRWLHIDPDSLEREASRAGWRTEVLVQEENGQYLARLSQQAIADHLHPPRTISQRGSCGRDNVRRLRKT
jgi:SAM-dependent methyltransferase